MQTFLPLKSFVKSMECLDQKRLGKQRVEAGQILEILCPEISVFKENTHFDRKFHAWEHHPAVQMWKGHEEWLKLYLACAVGEWRYRGYINNILGPSYETEKQEAPWWLGYEPFHLSHRSNLLRKFPTHYRQFWPEDLDTLQYLWPTQIEGLREVEPENSIQETANV